VEQWVGREPRTIFFVFAPSQAIGPGRLPSPEKTFCRGNAHCSESLNWIGPQAGRRTALPSLIFSEEEEVVKHSARHLHTSSTGPLCDVFVRKLCRVSGVNLRIELSPFQQCAGVVLICIRWNFAKATGSAPQWEAQKFSLAVVVVNVLLLGSLRYILVVFLARKT
jgi:hypothetical protein